MNYQWYSRDLLLRYTTALVHSFSKRCIVYRALHGQYLLWYDVSFYARRPTEVEIATPLYRFIFLTFSESAGVFFSSHRTISTWFFLYGPIQEFPTRKTDSPSISVSRLCSEFRTGATAAAAAESMRIRWLMDSIGRLTNCVWQTALLDAVVLSSSPNKVGTRETHRARERDRKRARDVWCWVMRVIGNQRWQPQPQHSAIISLFLSAIVYTAGQVDK
jgi:hypothetical protein